MVETPDVSIVIINWNRLDEVLRCIHYLKQQQGPRFELVVVDNGSTDGSGDRLSQIGSIKLVRLESNVGPAQARNIAIEQATGKYILFLDSDALLSKSGLAKLVAHMDSDPTIGIIGCRIINCFTRKPDQWIYAEPETTHGQREFDTYSFSAAGAIARAQTLRDAGPFWDELFIYNEEVDLSIRVLRAGYRIIYSPDVRVYHRVSNNGRTAPGVYWRLQSRNWIWIFYRHYPTFDRIKGILRCLLVYIIKGAIHFRLKDCIAGIVEGLRKTEIIRRFPDKLTRQEMDRFAALYQRRTLRMRR